MITSGNFSWLSKFIIIIILLLMSFSHQLQLVVLPWSLSDSKSCQNSSSTVVCMVSIPPLTYSLLLLLFWLLFIHLYIYLLMLQLLRQFLFCLEYETQDISLISSYWYVKLSWAKNDHSSLMTLYNIISIRKGISKIFVNSVVIL